MDDFNTYLQFLDDIDDNVLSQCDFPSFDIVNPDETLTFDSEMSNNDPPEDAALANTITTTTTSTNSSSPDESRFPVLSSADIEELQAVATNKNTQRSTKQWMNVFNSWCTSRHLDVDITTLSPQNLDNMLCQFYAEVKKQNGDDYEPESLRQMQSCIDRFLKEKSYNVSIVRAREFSKSQNVLNAKAMSLRQQGKGKRPNKSQPLEPEEESALWEKGQLGDFNARVLTNTNFKNLTEQLGLRGRQEHYDSYVEDFAIKQREDGSEIVEFKEGLTKTRSGGLRITHRKTPQTMFSTDGGCKDPVRLFKLWLSKRPEGMKDNGPLYLSVINRPKSTNIWYTKVRMGQNTIGTLMKSMSSCLNSTKKLTNHSMRKTLVAKLKRSGQPRNVICEITGHARESSLDDYDQIDENQRRDLSHIISGYKENSNQLAVVERAPPSPQSLRVDNALQRPPLAPLYLQQHHQQHQSSQLMSVSPFGGAGFPFQASFPSAQWYQHMASSVSSVGSASTPMTTYTNCTINNYHKDPPSSSQSPPRQKKRRAYIIESDED